MSLACPSLPLLSVSDSGLHYLTLPATAPFCSAFALSIAFTSLAALEVALVNVSVGKFLLFHRSCRCVSLFDATHVLPRLDAVPLCLRLFRGGGAKLQFCKWDSRQHCGGRGVGHDGFCCSALHLFLHTLPQLFG